MVAEYAYLHCGGEIHLGDRVPWVHLHDHVGRSLSMVKGYTDSIDCVATAKRPYASEQ
jgi:hypothetical protein